MLLERILMAIMLLEIPLQFDKYWGHVEEFAEFGAVSGFNVSLTTLCLPLLYAIWLPRFMYESMFPGGGRLRISLPLLIYVAFSGFSILVAHNRQLTLQAMWLMLQTLLIFIYLANAVRTRNDVFFVVSLLLGGVAIQGCLMVATKIVGDIQLGPFITASVDPNSQRACGTMGSANTVAGYLQLLLPLSIAFWLGSTVKWHRALALLAFVCGIVGLILTLSRGGWLGTTVSLLLLLCIGAQRRLINVSRIIAAAKLPLLAFIVVAVLLSPMILARLTSYDRGAARSRIPLNLLTLRMIAAHPLGVGANNNGNVARQYAAAGDFREEWIFTVHNKYLLVWSEIGLFGLIAFVCFLLSTVRSGWQVSKRLDPTMSMILLALTVGVAGQMVHMMVDIFNARPHVQILWICASLVLAISALHATRQEEPTPRPLAPVT